MSTGSPAIMKDSSSTSTVDSKTVDVESSVDQETPSHVVGDDKDVGNWSWEPGQLSLMILAGLAILHTLYFAKAVLFPVSLAFVLFFLLSPVVRFLTRLYVPEILAATIVVLSATLLVALAALALFGPASDWVAEAPETLQKARERLSFLIEPITQMDAATDKAAALATDEEDVEKVVVKQPGVSNAIVNTTANIAAATGITFVMLFMMLAMSHRTLNTIVELVPNVKDKRAVVELVREVERGISGYLITVSTINIVLGIVIGIAMALIGLPDPLLLGIMAGTLNFIPFIGCFAGAGITFLIAIVSLESTGMAMLAPAVYIAINSLEGNVITPMMLGRRMELNPAIVFLGIVIWGWAWGIGGALLSVPMLGILKITCDHFVKLKPVARFLAG